MSAESRRTSSSVRRKGGVVAASVALVISTLFVGSSANADVADSEDGFSEQQSVELDSKSRADLTTAAICNFDQAGDWPQFSSDGSGELSAHGWWQNVDCDATLGTVTVKIQVRNWLGFWFDVGTPGEKTVSEGGGAGKRATARYTCNGSGPRDFRTWVSVDPIGIADAPNATVSGSVNRACG